jgi:outer membrane protein TolC
MLKKACTYLFCIFIAFQAKAQERTLNHYINQGVSNSPLLKGYQNQAKLNIQDSLLIKAGQKPKIDATGQILVPPYGKNFGYDEAITNGGNYSAVVGVSQNFFMKNVLNNQYENLGLQSKTASNNAKITEQELKKLITGQYITAYSTYNEVLFSKELLDLLKEEAQFLKQLVEKGIYKQSDYLSLLIEEQTQESNVIQQQIQYRQELYAINFVCGISDTSVYVLADPDIAQTNGLNYENSPVFQKFRIDSLITLNTQKGFSLKYRPALGWFTDMGINSTDPWQAYRHFGFSFGLNFKMPLYDGKQKNIEIQKLQINEDSRKNYETFYKKQYEQKVFQLKQKIGSYNLLAVQFKKQLNSIETLIKMNKQQLNIGDLSITEHIQTIKNYLETKHQMNTLQFEKMQMMNELNYISF